MGDDDRLGGLAGAQRARMSDAERKLWFAVRARRLGGLKFRRQHPMGPYVADFYCAEAGLVVEVDGNHHSEPAQVERDEVRDDWMTTQGLNVLRSRCTRSCRTSTRSRSGSGWKLLLTTEVERLTARRFYCPSLPPPLGFGISPRKPGREEPHHPVGT